MTPERLIELLSLEPLPVEGGYFRRTYLASDAVPLAGLPGRYAGPKPFSSSIYYLLKPGEVSVVHRLRTDEVYHFYLGGPVELLLLYPGGGSDVVGLGSDIEAGEHVQYVVPRGVWQGARLRGGGAYALMGTTMAPAFDESDFELGEREALSRQYPAQAEMIRLLTRPS